MPGVDMHPSPAGWDRLALAEEMVDAALGAQRQRAIGALVRQRPRLARWLLRPYLRIVRGTLGAEGGVDDLVRCVESLLRWGVTQLRPDREPSLEGMPEQAWLHLQGWRPMLAFACQAGLIDVPKFPGHYRPGPTEATVEHLCGLWNVGESTFYRCLERARRQLAQLALERRPDAVRAASLRTFVVDERWRGQDPALRRDWHVRQAQTRHQQGDPVSALWHAAQAGDITQTAEIIRLHAPLLSTEPETAPLAEACLARATSDRERVELLLAMSHLARTRQDVDGELRLLERALATARGSQAPLLMGLVYAAMAQFFETRDADRAFACCNDSLAYLLAADPEQQDAAIASHRGRALVRSAWLHVVRDHPQAKSILDEAEGLRQRHAVSDDLAGMLEQSWGEYWRRAGDVPRSSEARHRALNIFERLGDQRSVLVTYLNLVLLHAGAKEVRLAEQWAARVFDAAQRVGVEPVILASTHGNLAVAYMQVGQYDQAAVSLRSALDISVAAQLQLPANRARLNLASTHFRLYMATGLAEHEREGDRLLQDFFATPESEKTEPLVELARGLKAEVLGNRPERVAEALLDDETAHHLQAFAEVRRQRALLAVQGPPEQAVRARFAIAHAYVEIAAKERDAAWQQAQALSISEQFAAQIEQLEARFRMDRSARSALGLAWQARAADLLDAPRRRILLSALFDHGSLSKKLYADTCGVSPATASKHLAVLTQRGLLVQSGKGPSTRYRAATSLPDRPEDPSGSPGP